MPFFDGERVLGLGQIDLVSLYQWRWYSANSLLNGEIPLWNPHTFSGMPFLANPQTAIFYPLNWLFLILPMAWAINLNYLLHLAFAAMGTYFLARQVRLSFPASILSAISFSFSSLFLNRIYIGHFTIVQTLSYLPWLILSARKWIALPSLKRALPLSILASLAFLAGHPQYFFYLALGILFLLLYQFSLRNINPRHLKSLLPALILFLLLVAVQLLPSMEFNLYSVRDEPFSFEQASTGSISLHHLISLFWSEYFGDGVRGFYWGDVYFWEMTFFLGIVPLSLALVGMFSGWNKEKGFFLLLGALSLLISLGKNTPFFWLIYHLLPYSAHFRLTSRAMAIFGLTIAVGAGYGYDSLFSSLNTPFSARRIAEYLKENRAILALVLALVVAIFYGSFYVYKAAGTIERWDDFYLKRLILCGRYPATSLDLPAGSLSLSRLLFLHSWYKTACFAILMLIYLLLKRKIPAITVIVLLILELSLNAQSLFKTAKITDLKLNEDLVAALKTDDFSRYATNNQTLLNRSFAAGLFDASGFDANILKSYATFLNVIQGKESQGYQLSTYFYGFPQKMLEMLGICKLLVLRGTPFDPDRFEVIGSFKEGLVLRNRFCPARARILHKAMLVRDQQQALAIIAGKDFDPSELMLINSSLTAKSDGNEPDTQSRSGNDESVEVLHYCGNRLKLRAFLNSPGYLLLTEVYYPGWIAFDNGQRAEILRADFLLRGLKLAPGEHLLELLYAPFSFRLGLFLSLASLALLSASLVKILFFNSFVVKQNLPKRKQFATDNF